MIFMGIFDSMKSLSINFNSIVLYHGSKCIIKEPLYNYGSEDNDYGSGFYTTEFRDKAEDWALLNGDKNKVGIVNKYSVDISNLNIINLDDYGVFAWVAEIISHRFINNIAISEFRDEFIQKYKIDTSDADIIVGYRADDSYSTILDYFMSNKITEEEVRKLFYKGSLGVQYFIKSRKAFGNIKFIDSYEVNEKLLRDDIVARREVLEFLSKRDSEILRRTFNGHITVLDAITDNYVYNKEYGYYEKR